MSYIPKSTSKCLFDTLYGITFSACECDLGGTYAPHCNADGQCSCDDISGICKCKEHVVGDKCIQCKNAFYDFPECKGML